MSVVVLCLVAVEVVMSVVAVAVVVQVVSVNVVFPSVGPLFCLRNVRVVVVVRLSVFVLRLDVFVANFVVNVVGPVYVGVRSVVVVGPV